MKCEIFVYKYYFIFYNKQYVILFRDYLNMGEILSKIIAQVINDVDWINNGKQSWQGD